MTELLDSLLVFAILFGSGLLGLFVRPLLAEHHRSMDTLELVRLVTTMLLTFAAIVLGLLTTSVKSSYDTVSTDLRGMGFNLIRLDQSMRAYGPETDKARGVLRQYATEVIATTWPREPAPPGADPSFPLSHRAHNTRLESPALGDMLSEIEGMLRRLHPSDAMQQRLQNYAMSQYERLNARRWKLIEEAESSISRPFYVVMIFWLSVMFLGFGLSAQRNLLVLVMIGLGAGAIASVVFVIVDLDTPFTGLFGMSSQPIREALDQMSR